jgi:hypothetical protein
MLEGVESDAALVGQAATILKIADGMVVETLSKPQAAPGAPPEQGSGEP